MSLKFVLISFMFNDIINVYIGLMNERSKSLTALCVVLFFSYYSAMKLCATRPSVEVQKLVILPVHGRQNRCPVLENFNQIVIHLSSLRKVVTNGINEDLIITLWPLCKTRRLEHCLMCYGLTSVQGERKAENTIRRMLLINGKYLNGVCFMKHLLFLIETMQFTFVYEQFFRTVSRHLSNTLNLFMGI